MNEFKVWEWEIQGVVKNWIVVGWFLAILMEPNWYQIISNPKNARFCRWFQGVTCEVSNIHAMPRPEKAKDLQDTGQSGQSSKSHLWRKNRWTKRQPLKLRGPVASFCWTTFPMFFWDPDNVYLYVCLVGGGRAEQIIWRNRLHGSIDLRNSRRGVDSTVDASNWHACSGSNALIREETCYTMLHYVTLCYTMLHYVTLCYTSAYSF
jgi:hypothetical protein